jgi:hypothetical protein
MIGRSPTRWWQPQGQGRILIFGCRTLVQLLVPGQRSRHRVLRPAAADRHGRGIRAARRCQPAHQNDVRSPSERQHCLGDRRRRLQRQDQHWLRSAAADRDRGGRPRRAGRRRNHRHGLRLQQLAREHGLLGQRFGNRRHHLQRQHHDRVRAESADSPNRCQSRLSCRRPRDRHLLRPRTGGQSLGDHQQRHVQRDGQDGRRQTTPSTPAGVNAFSVVTD